MTRNVDHINLVLAHAEAEKSLDPSTQVGAVLVEAGQARRHLSHNTFLSLADPATATREERYADVLHAEEHLMLQVGPHLAAGATVYCSQEPCGRCWKLLTYMGVRRVVHSPTTPDRRERWNCDEGRALAVKAGLDIEEVR